MNAEVNNSKQRIKTLFVCILLTVFCSSLIVSEVDTFADNRSYEIYEYTINVAVNTDGSPILKKLSDMIFTEVLMEFTVI